MRRRNWETLSFDFSAIASPTIFGPFDVEADGLLVQQGQGSQLFLVDELVSTDQIALIGVEFLYDVGLQLGVAGAFYPCKTDRFWIVSGAPIATTTVLTFFRDIVIPPTR